MALPALVVVDEIITNGEVYLNHNVNNPAWTYCRTQMRKWKSAAVNDSWRFWLLQVMRVYTEDAFTVYCWYLVQTKFNECHADDSFDCCCCFRWVITVGIHFLWQTSNAIGGWREATKFLSISRCFYVRAFSCSGSCIPVVWFFKAFESNNVSLSMSWMPMGLWDPIHAGCVLSAYL